MKAYNDLSEVKTALKNGTFPLGEEVAVDGITYRQLISSKYHLIEILNGAAPIVVYSYTKDEDNVRAYKEQTELKEWITLVWRANDQLEVVPHNVATTTAARVHANLSQPTTEAMQQPTDGNQDNIIGDTVKIRITNLTDSKPIRGKVDTGATLCSLHATDIQTNDGRVSFKCEHLSNNTITAQLANTQAVQSADGGIEQRPCIQLNVEVNGKHYDGILFNLNDRSNMKAPLLVGQNLLEKGKFLINPSLREDEEIDWEALVEDLMEQGVFEEETPNPVDNIVTLMYKYGISLNDIVEQDRKKALES